MHGRGEEEDEGTGSFVDLYSCIYIDNEQLKQTMSISLPRTARIRTRPSNKDVILCRYQTRQVDYVEGRCLGGDEAAVRPHADHAGVDHARHHPRQPACLHAAAITSRPDRLCHPESRLRHRL